MNHKLSELFNNGFDDHIRSHILEITQKYADAGYECYIVGGPVRDLLLGLKPNDVDLATNCPLDETLKIFKNVIPTGVGHGTLTIKIDGYCYEVTRYRKDTSCDGRHASVEFTDTINEDVLRRDLTVNAIAYNPLIDDLVDVVGGINDIESRVLRFVGNTKDRVLEDHLRFIRLLRFKVKLGFTVGEEVISDARDVFDVDVLSLERIYDEFGKMFSNGLTDEDVDFLDKSLRGMLSFDFINHDPEVSNKIVRDILQLSSLFPIVYHNGWKPEFRLGIVHKKILQLFNTFDKKLHIKQLLNVANKDVEIVTEVLKYHQHYKYTEATHFEDDITHIIENNEPVSICDLKINGLALQKVGFHGSDIGEKLKVCLDLVHNHPDRNTVDILMKYVTK